MRDADQVVNRSTGDARMSEIVVPRRWWRRYEGVSLCVDLQTQEALGVGMNARDDSGLIGLINRTKTHAGSVELAERFRRPIVDAEGIRLVQGALAALREYQWNLPIDEELYSCVERYIGSTVEMCESASLWARVRFLWRVARYGDNRAAVSRGVRGVRQLLERVRAFCLTAGAAEPSGHAAGVVQECLLHVAAVENDHGRGFGSWDMLGLARADWWFRGPSANHLLALLWIMRDLDAMICMARFGDSAEFTTPEVVNGESVQLVARYLRHPLIAEAVGNSLDLGRSGNVLFLTGPNMAGKSTFMQAVGLAVLLAHMGMRVPASSFRFVPLQSLFAHMGAQGDVATGTSRFLAEVRRLRVVAEYLARGDRTLGLLDEPFTGTNVVEAREATMRLASELSQVAGSLFAIASHHDEVACALRARGVLAACFEGECLESGSYRFDYLLRPGVSAQRLGLQILDSELIWHHLQLAIGRS